MNCTFTPVGKRYSLGFERQLPHPPEKVWRVLTDRSLLRQWFPCDIVGTWQPGEPLRFVFPNGEGEDLAEEELQGEVLTVEPHRLLEFRWGKHRLRFELTADGDGCRFRFSESVLDPSIGARNAAGWQLCFENLELILQGAEAALFVFEVWQKRFQHYASRFTQEFGPQQGAPESFQQNRPSQTTPSDG